MKKIIIAIAVVALAAIVGIGAGYYFTHQGSTSVTDLISETEAQNIALEDAGFSQDAVNFTKTTLDRDDGRSQYDIEFIVSADNAKYDYEIDAESGAILSVDREQGRDSSSAQTDGSQQNTTTTSNPQSAGEISADEAKAIALEHAGVAEADALYVNIEYDRDDGRTEWSVDFATQDTEYDYEIAAADGSIIKSEREPYRR